MVDLQKWEAAQLAEKKHHTYSEAEGLAHYRESYEQYFAYTGASFIPTDKFILEIGPADFPALRYCQGYKQGIIIEPMPSELLQKWAETQKNILLLTHPAEELDILDSTDDVGGLLVVFRDGMLHSVDSPPPVEVWLFNVLQHVQDPDLIVSKCKRFADTIRFFEPINCGTDDCHLWDLTMDMFKGWFGEKNVQYYPPNPHAVNFHTHECAYGIWHKTDQ